MIAGDTVFEGLLPFESWERLTGESSGAFAAFCCYRDFGPERNMSKAVKTMEADPARAAKRYRMWRLWSMQFKWRERAAAYDQYLDRIKLAAKRRTLEAQEEADREALAKMVATGNKAMDMLDPAKLCPEAIWNFIGTGVRLNREGAGFSSRKNGEEGDQELQPSIVFSPGFKGL
ncbi:hypothetical protein FACS189491_02440 [Spirochaetia bacterium]|nr:hypothetical protein FACS189491_02440 [Spirochaetia bacterium]